MNFIVNKTVEIIRRNIPSSDGETMIRIDGFEDVRFYDALARAITNEFKDSGLSVDIKLANNKWQYFSKDFSNTSYLQSLKQHGWVAENESITRYRNLHKSNILILMGTELEEDKGGLLNCYCITSDTILADIDGHYNEVFLYLSEFGDSEKAIIDKVYGDLFAYVPADVYRLSNIADEWENYISDLKDFINLFFANLNKWGLPKRERNLPTYKELRGKKNVLELQNKFISRSMFRRMTMKQYADYQAKLEKYKKECGEYGQNWDGWSEQSISGYDHFAKVVMEYARGEKVESNRKLLEGTDFDIVSSVLDIKLEKTVVERKTNIKLKGNPLPVFTKALLYTLMNCVGEDIEKISFSISQGTIVSLYSEAEGIEEKEQLVETWKTICRHVNGLIEMINQRSWKLHDVDVEVICCPLN